MSQTCVINAQVHATKSRWNFLQWTRPIHPIGPQAHVLGYFGPFRYYTNLGAKRGQTGAISKLVRATKSCLIFPQRTYLIHPIGPQTHVLEHFGRFLYYTNFGANWTELVINAQVRATMSRQNFLQQSHPIHPIGPQTHVLGTLGPFRYCTNFGTVLKFFATNASDPPLDPKLLFRGVSECSITVWSLVQIRLNWGH
jgi:hypothetical protein